ANFTGFTARVASSCRRHADNKLARTPCRSATACTEAPATRLSATIRRRCCAVHLPRRRGATDSGTVSTASSGFAIDLLLGADLAPRQRGSLRREDSFQGPRPHAYNGIGIGDEKSALRQMLLHDGERLRPALVQ